MAVLYIVGERPGVGATSIVASLTQRWTRGGQRVVAVKPASLSEEVPEAGLLDRLSTGSSSGPAVVVDPGVPDDALLDKAAARVNALAEKADVVVVEGLPRTTEDGSLVDSSPALAERIGARVIGIARYQQSLDASSADGWREAYASSLAGVVVNRRTRYGQHDAVSRLTPAFEDAGVSVVGVVPEERMLLAPTVRQMADLLDGTFYAGLSGESALIEHFIIGGLLTEGAAGYFERLPNQAVIARGGRMDIQMSALSFPLNCLVLTGCKEPPQYVYQRAVDLDVPLIVTDRDTHETATALETLGERVSFDHPAKVDYLADRLDGVLDMSAMRSAAGLR
jgi:BioD-like phosphotransacetylase family protein